MPTQMLDSRTENLAGKKYSLKKNSRFGFWQIHPTPSVEEITRFYAKEFYSSDYPRCNDSSLDVQIRDKDYYDQCREAMCETLEQITGRSLSGLSILDIGCGWGQALLYFRAKGIHCHGFDPVPEAVAYAKSQKLNVVEAGMDKMDVFSGKRFDVVTLLNVLEHLADPIRILSEIRKKVLRPGGILVIDVPNEFNAFQIAGQHVHKLPQWWVVPPAHLNYFSGTSLRKLLTGTGYRVDSLESSFPLELFLLFGSNYVQDSALGRKCHEQRMAFEMNLRRQGQAQALRTFYRSLAKQNLGRQIIAYAVSSKRK